MVTEPARRTKASFDARAVEVAWRLLDVSREHVRTLEDSVTRVAAAQIGGLIALWTQLYTFDAVLTRGLAYAALALLITSMLLLAWLATPQRLTRFWDSVPTHDLLIRGQELSLDDEVELVAEVRDSLVRQIVRLRRGLRASVALAATALLMTLVAYAIDKT